MRPTILLTEPLPAEPPHPDTIYDRLGTVSYSIDPHLQKVHYQVTYGFMQDGEFRPGVLDVIRGDIHNDVACAAFFAAMTTDEMDTVLLQWVLDHGMVQGTLS